MKQLYPLHTKRAFKVSSITSKSGSSFKLFETGKLSSFIPIAFAIVLLLTLTSPVFGQVEKVQDTAGKSISEIRGTIHLLQQGITQQENKISETQTTERNILSELEDLDKKLAVQQTKLDHLESKIREQQVTINKEENALEKSRTQKSIVEKHLQKRITAYYTMGNIGLMNVTFSTKTLPELLTFNDAFNVLIKYDQDLIKVYRDTIERLVRVTAALDLEKTVLENFFNQTVIEKEMLQKTATEKKTLLSHVRTEEKLHEQAVSEMQQASENLAASIVEMKKKDQIHEQRFLADKGHLPPPVNGILSTLFHQEKTNKLSITRKSEGIELQAPDGTKIVAVCDGDVIFSGYLRGYGNTVIIHHGFQYYTVTSRIENILVEKGQKVKQQDTIGIMGDTATLFGEGLYFEIRHGRESLDPLLWLDPNRLSSLHEQPVAPIGSDSSVN